MTALPEDIGRLTNNGIVVATDAAVGAAIRVLHPDAQPTGITPEREMFYTNPAHAQAVLDEAFSYQQVSSPFHIGIDIDETLGLGGNLPVAPKVPCFTVIDPRRDASELCRTRSFAEDTNLDKYSVEFLA